MSKDKKFTRDEEEKDYTRNGRSNKNDRNRRPNGNNYRDRKPGSGTNNGKVNHTNNNPKWYYSNPELLQLATGSNWATSLGFPMDISDAIGMDPATYDPAFDTAKLITNYTVPGIMRIDVAPILGMAASATDPVNLAANSIFQLVRARNQGSLKADASDIMFYLGAADSLITCYSWMCFVYAALTSAASMNVYYPRGIMESMGFNYNNMLANRSDFYAWLCSIPAMMSQVVAPAALPIFQRHISMFSKFYADNTTAKAQTVYFRPSGFYKYEYVPVEIGGVQVYHNQLTWKRLPDSITFATLKGYFEDMLNAYLKMEDFGTIGGYLKNVYGEDQLIRLGTVPFDALPILERDSGDILGQLENATICGQLANLDVTPDTSISPTGGNLVCKPHAPSAREGRSKFFVCHTDTPTPEDVITMSRFTSFWDATSPSTGVFNHPCITCGTEIIEGIEVYKYVASIGANPYGLTLDHTGLSSNVVNIGPAGDVASVTSAIRAIADISAFNKHPVISVVAETTTEEVPKMTWSGFISQIDNYKIWDVEQQRTLDRLAVMNEFGLSY